MAVIDLKLSLEPLPSCVFLSSLCTELLLHRDHHFNLPYFTENKINKNKTAYTTETAVTEPELIQAFCNYITQFCTLVVNQTGPSYRSARDVFVLDCQPSNRQDWLYLFKLLLSRSDTWALPLVITCSFTAGLSFSHTIEAVWSNHQTFVTHNLSMG